MIRGALARTVVCVTSDHGDLLGAGAEGHRYGKRTVARAAVYVPLACAGPGIEPRRIVRSPVAQIDLTATLREYARVSPPAGRAPARSLAAALAPGGARDARHRRIVVSQWRAEAVAVALEGDALYELLAEELVPCQGRIGEALRSATLWKYAADAPAAAAATRADERGGDAAAVGRALRKAVLGHFKPPLGWDAACKVWKAQQENLKAQEAAKQGAKSAQRRLLSAPVPS